MKKRKIIFTGGGSAGHVIPNLAIIEKCLAARWSVAYIGSVNGIERKIINEKKIGYFAIPTGKLRRYFSWRNFIDPFKILAGVVRAFFLCKKIKPDVVFSKGGFVAFPVVIAAWLNKIPVVIHESDLTPGLANKLSFPFVKKICLTSELTAKYIKDKEKIVVTGTPLRKVLFSANAAKGRKFCGFNANKKIIAIYGGGSGSGVINEIVRQTLPALLKKYQVAHICGRGNIDPLLEQLGYKQFEYLNDEFADVLAAADFVVSRAGATSLYELLALHKPHILIPLPKKSSRGDQLENAVHFAQQQLSQVIYQEELSAEKLLDKILWLNEHQQDVLEKLDGYKKPDSNRLIYDTLSKILK